MVPSCPRRHGRDTCADSCQTIDTGRMSTAHDAECARQAKENDPGDEPDMLGWLFDAMDDHVARGGRVTFFGRVIGGPQEEIGKMYSDVVCREDKKASE